MCGPMDHRRVAKNHVLLELDKAYASHKNRQKAALELEKETPHGQFILNEGWISQEEADILNARFYTDPHPEEPWRKHANRRQIVSDGFRAALRASFGIDPDACQVDLHDIERAHTSLPIQTLWVCSGGSFECVVSRSHHQVTLLLLTPPLPDPYTIKTTELEGDGLWMVANHNESFALWGTQDGHHRKKPSTLSNPGVYVTRVLGGPDIL